MTSSVFAGKGRGFLTSRVIIVGFQAVSLSLEMIEVAASTLRQNGYFAARAFQDPSTLIQPSGEISAHPRCSFAAVFSIVIGTALVPPSFRIPPPLFPNYDSRNEIELQH